MVFFVKLGVLMDVADIKRVIDAFLLLFASKCMHAVYL